MTDAQILAALAGIAHEHAAVVGPVGADDDLVADLGLDSLTATALVIAIEDRFRIDLPDDELAGVRRVHELVAIVARKVAPC